jgi:hypothetical protein
VAATLRRENATKQSLIEHRYSLDPMGVERAGINENLNYERHAQKRQRRKTRQEAQQKQNRKRQFRRGRQLSSQFWRNNGQFVFIGE